MNKLLISTAAAVSSLAISAPAVAEAPVKSAKPQLTIEQCTAERSRLDDAMTKTRMALITKIFPNNFVEHKVKKGETIDSIGLSYPRASLAGSALYELNDDRGPLREGEIIMVPNPNAKPRDGYEPYSIAANYAHAYRGNSTSSLAKDFDDNAARCEGAPRNEIARCLQAGVLTIIPDDNVLGECEDLTAKECRAERRAERIERAHERKLATQPAACQAALEKDKKANGSLMRLANMFRK